MTNQQILQKAFQKAYDNGWWKVEYGDRCPPVVEGVDYMSWLYSHDFARALWGEDFVHGNFTTQPLHNWESKLMEMVISKDPIKYLGDNINE